MVWVLLCQADEIAHIEGEDNALLCCRTAQLKFVVSVLSNPRGRCARDIVTADSQRDKQRFIGGVSVQMQAWCGHARVGHPLTVKR